MARARASAVMRAANGAISASASPRSAARRAGVELARARRRAARDRARRGARRIAVLASPRACFAVARDRSSSRTAVVELRDRTPATRPPAAQRRQPRDGAIDVRGQRVALRPAPRRPSPASTQLRHADGAAPVVEQRRGCRPRRTRRAPAGAAAPSRSSARSSDRCRGTPPPAARPARPSRDTCSNTGPTIANQVAFVLPTQVRLDLRGSTRRDPITRAGSLLPDQAQAVERQVRRPRAGWSRSRPRCTSASPPVAITIAASPPAARARIRRTRPSTIST